MVLIDISLKTFSNLLRNKKFITKREKNEFSLKPKIIFNKAKKSNDLSSKGELTKVNYILKNLIIIIVLYNF